MLSERPSLLTAPFVKPWLFVGAFCVLALLLVFASSPLGERRVENGVPIFGKNEQAKQKLYENPNCDVRRRPDMTFQVSCPGLPQPQQEKLARQLNGIESDWTHQTPTEYANNCVRDWAAYDVVCRELGGDDIHLIKAVAPPLFAGLCLVTGILVLLISFPVYLFSSNKERSKKAGGLVKSSFAFVTATGAACLKLF